MSHIVLYHLPAPMERVSQGGAPEFQTTIINMNSAGNNTFAVCLTRNVESPSAMPKNGWTFQVSDDQTTWTTLDLTNATAVINGNAISFDLSGNTRGTFSSTHYLRTSYSSATGDIRSSVDQTDLATFGPSDNHANNSTVDLTSNIAGSGEGWYKMEEASGQPREAVNGLATWQLADTNTVGTRTGASGSGLATDHSGTNYLSKNTIYSAPADGKFTIAFYYIQDTLPSVKAAGDAYPVNRWSGGSNREWGIVIPETTGGAVVADRPYLVGENDTNNGFAQHFSNRGAFTNATWYIIFMVYDPDASVPVIGYTQQLNTPADFTVEDDTYVAPASGDPHVQSVGGSVALQVGDVSGIGVHQGVDGGVDTLIMWERALTQAECAAIAEGYGDPPFYPDNV